jgi:hypothetical protein
VKIQAYSWAHLEALVIFFGECIEVIALINVFWKPWNRVSMLDVVGIGSGTRESTWSSPEPTTTFGPMFDQGQ